MARRLPPAFLWFPPLILLGILGLALWQGPDLYRRFSLARAEGEAQAARAASAGDPTLPNLSIAFNRVAESVKPALVHIAVLDDKNVMIGHGSGWIWSESGHIVTCCHVISEATKPESNAQILVRLYDGSSWPATIVGSDTDSDVAVLSIQTSHLPQPLPLRPGVRADDPAVKQGEWVFAFGSPLNFPFSMTHGIVSFADRKAHLNVAHIQSLGEYIQTDAPLNPGHSGGPLTDSQGRVVGMNAAIASGDERWFGVGLATPIHKVTQVANSLIAHGEIPHGYLGLLTMAIAPASGDGLEPTSPVAGVRIQQVMPGSPAAKAKIQVNDILLAVDAIQMRAPEDLMAAIGNRSPGDKVFCHLLRDDQPMDVEVELGSRPRR